jgi:hypothetical protein
LETPEQGHVARNDGVQLSGVEGVERLVVHQREGSSASVVS